MQVKFIGLDKLSQALLEKSKDAEAIKRVVRHNGQALDRKMHNNAVFTHGYSTGATKQSIRSEYLDNGFTVVVAPHTEYSPYVEYGTRFMEAQPFVRPSFNEQKEIFKKELKELVK